MNYKYAFRYALTGAAFGLLFPIIATLIEIKNANLTLTSANYLDVQIQNQLLWIIDTAPIFLGIFAGLIGIRQDILTRQNDQLENEIFFRKQAFTEIEELKNNLDQQVQERTLLLERKVLQLRASAEVGEAITSIRDIKTLLSKVSILIAEQFGFYHIGIFLLDRQKQSAVLQATNSEGGQKMLARNHNLKIGKMGIVSYAIQEREARIAQAVTSDEVFFDNPDLPDTRSEMALPLITGGQILGALDIQSVEEKAFHKDDIAVLQTLTNQVAIAIENARLFSDYQASLDKTQLTYFEESQRAWENISTGQDHLGYQYLQGEVLRVDSNIGDIHTDQPELPEISLPIEIGTQTVGYITAHKPSPDLGWNKSEIAIMETLSEQLGVALESARLYQDTQLRAAREQLTGEVTTRIRETMDIETIIRTASEEIRKALNLPEVIIRLGEPSTDFDKGMKE